MHNAKFLRIASDLHLDVNRDYDDHPLLANNDRNKETVLILAGDIMNNLAIGFYKFNSQPLQTEVWKRFLVKLSHIYKYVILVLGNHDFYFEKFENTSALLEKTIDSFGIKNFIFLNDSSVEFNNIKFIGCTLWTDLKKGDPSTMVKAAALNNDYREIAKGPGMGASKLTYNDTIAAHKNSLKFIDQELKHTNKKTIVITHHAPSLKSIDVEKYSKSSYGDITYMYASDLDGFILQHDDKVPLWIHGHTHDSCDYKIGKTRVVCNSFGLKSQAKKNGFIGDFHIAIDDLVTGNDSRIYRECVRVLVTKGDEVLLAKKYDKEGNFTNYAFPGGGIDGMILEEAAKQECFEEAEVVITDISSLGIEVEIPYEYPNERKILFKGVKDIYVKAIFVSESKLKSSANDKMDFEFVNWRKAVKAFKDTSESKEDATFNKYKISALMKAFE